MKPTISYFKGILHGINKTAEQSWSTDYEEYEESVYEYQFIYGAGGNKEEPFWEDEASITVEYELWSELPHNNCMMF